MKKELITEINRQKELMGLNKGFLTESIPVTGILSVIKKIAQKAATAGDNVVKREFDSLKKLGSAIDNAQGVTKTFQALNGLADNVTKLKYFDDVLEAVDPNVKNGLDTLKKAVTDGTIPEDQIETVLTSAGSLLEKNTDKNILDLFVLYCKKDLKPNVVNNTLDMAQVIKNQTKDEIGKIRTALETEFASVKGPKKRILQDALNKLDNFIDDVVSGQKTIPITAVKNYADGMASKIRNAPEQSWFRRYVIQKIKQNPVVGLATTGAIAVGLVGFILLCIDYGLGTDYFGGALELLRKISPGDADRVQEHINNRSGGENSGPIKGDNETVKANNDTDWSDYDTGN